MHNRKKFDHRMEWFAFVAPAGVCVVCMVRGVYVLCVDDMDSFYFESEFWHPMLVKTISHLKGEMRRCLTIYI